MRSIAADAGVDPALVAHFFGTKQRLFVDVVQLPFQPEHVLPAVLAGDPEQSGQRLAEFLLTTLEDPEARRRMTGLVRAAASEPQAAHMVRERIAREVFARIIDALGVDDADLRASLLGSQVVGLIMARYIIAFEPLASLPAERAAAAIAPNLQHYLTGPLQDR